MKSILLGLTAILALIVTPALAADMPVKAPAVPVVSPEYNWSGFYAGANAGWVDGSYKWAYANPAPVACCAPFSASVNDGIFGGHVGAQWQWSHVVLGIEGAASGFGKSKTASSAGCIGGNPANSCQIQPGAIETLGGRLGWASNNWLFYGDGGGARSGIGSQFWSTPTTIFDTSSGPSYKGWYAGGGVEYMLAKGTLFDLIGGVEYQHVDLGTQYQASSADGFASSPPGVNGRNIGAKDDIVRFRLSVKSNPFAH